MSLYRHQTIDVNIDGTFQYDEWHANREKYGIKGKDVRQFAIRLDNDYTGMAWVFNSMMNRIRWFTNFKNEIVVNMYDPFYEGYRVKV